MSTLLDIVATVADEAASRLPEGDARQQVIADAPPARGAVRVAVGGRVSAGKSTLVNALLGQRVLVAGAGEVTRVVTWLRYGDVDDAVAVLDDGRRCRLRSARAGRCRPTSESTRAASSGSTSASTTARSSMSSTSTRPACSRSPTG